MVRVHQRNNNSISETLKKDKFSVAKDVGEGWVEQREYLRLCVTI